MTSYGRVTSSVTWPFYSASRRFISYMPSIESPKWPKPPFQTEIRQIQADCKLLLVASLDSREHKITQQWQVSCDIFTLLIYNLFIIFVGGACAVGVVLTDVRLFAGWSLVTVGRWLGGICGDCLFRSNTTVVHLTSTVEQTATHTRQYTTGKWPYYMAPTVV